jgi:hypothetical protein
LEYHCYWLSVGCFTLPRAASWTLCEPASIIFSLTNGIDRTQVYLNFHPGILDMAGAQDPNTWEAQFPVAKIPYSISSLVTSDPSNVTLTVTSADLLKWNVLFVMEQLDSEWLISKMYKDVFPAAATTLIIE